MPRDSTAIDDIFMRALLANFCDELIFEENSRSGATMCSTLYQRKSVWGGFSVMRGALCFLSLCSVDQYRMLSACVLGKHPTNSFGWDDNIWSYAVDLRHSFNNMSFLDHVVDTKERLQTLTICLNECQLLPTSISAIVMAYSAEQSRSAHFTDWIRTRKGGAVWERACAVASARIGIDYGINVHGRRLRDR
jgi:hypothetical protein